MSEILIIGVNKMNELIDKDPGLVKELTSDPCRRFYLSFSYPDSLYCIRGSRADIMLELLSESDEMIVEVSEECMHYSKPDKADEEVTKADDREDFKQNLCTILDLFEGKAYDVLKEKIKESLHLAHKYMKSSDKKTEEIPDKIVGAGMSSLSLVGLMNILH